MNIHSEKEYLKELKFTHEKQIQLGKINNASNTLQLISDCEKRIQELEKYKSKKTILTSDGIMWKPLKDYEDTHLISSSGLIKKKQYYSINENGIKRLINSQMVALYEDKDYLKVIISTQKTTKRFVVSNLVYGNFIEEIPPYYMAKNKDGNIYNNDVSNLYLSKVDTTLKKYRNKIKNIA